MMDIISNRAAFRKLAYTKFHSTPLYLEWAPEGAFKSELGAKPEEEVVEKESVLEKIEEETVDEEPLGAPEPDTTIFVKNLNFDTTEKTLKEFFSKVGQVYSATIATKKDNKRQGKKISFTLLQQTIKSYLLREG
jgi:multiple RNA-binding domain-containing protein 1